ncbi:MAG: DUF3175 domain-containing protein [Proteobacteria bacterium]|nr:DUF3175 domain-containing protein [Pseudomonadota bacterium]
MTGHRKRKATTKKRRWSGAVTRRSNALDLKKKIFTSDDPNRIAASLKRSAEHSRRRKSTPYRSAMSMLTFYINRAGKDLPAKQKRVLERAKDALREKFGKKKR